MDIRLVEHEPDQASDQADTAIRWRQMAREHGRAVAGKPGGDQRSSKTDFHAERIMVMLDENGDITLAEIQSGLAAQGVKVGIGTLWRFDRDIHRAGPCCISARSRCRCRPHIWSLMTYRSGTDHSRVVATEN